MISIRRLLDNKPDSPDDADLLDTAVRLRNLLTGAVASRRPLKRELGSPDFKMVLRQLLNRLEKANSPDELAVIAADALSAAEDYIREAGKAVEEHSGQMQSMIAMLTNAVRDMTGHSESSVWRLQKIEVQIKRASALDDLRPLKASLADCLSAVRDAAAEQKKATQATVERLREHIQRAPQPPVAAWGFPGGAAAAAGAMEAPDFVATFRLQRADLIAKRFGDAARDHMVSLLGEGLEGAQGPSDRLMRWKDASFVMLLSSPESLPVVRRKLSLAVSRISQRYVELGKNAALLAVAVDWTVIARAQFPSLDVAFQLVDEFLAGTLGAASNPAQGKSTPAGVRDLASPPLPAAM